MDALGAIYKLVFDDLVFVGVMLLLVVLLAGRKQAAYAVLKRNFLGYFSNPTGYVFLCLFVLLTSMAAFWPHEFFVANMATLGQLNIWFPIIMLFFIPAITMSIWADERRQGTDELLLTLPADDFDIVVGKYLASASIYTASLLFSQISTFIVLIFLTEGRVDTGLFFSNYLGYWCIGLAMIAIGMVASFLTSNLTVGFILGALFNAPLAFAAKSDVIARDRNWAREIKEYSLTERFDDFGRGMISLSSLAFFMLLAVVGLYLCMVLIGRRHWSGGKDGNSMFLHFVARAILLVGIAGGASYFFRNNDFRYDATDGKVVSLSPVTRKLIQSMHPDRTIVVDAFISADIPEQYAKTRYDLISRLQEFESTAKRSKIPIQVRINDKIDVFSEEAKRAKDAFGIVPQPVRARERGALRDQLVIMGAAFTSGLEKVIVPFFESGIPVEYELARSLTTVSRPARKKLGILRTDAQLNGGFSMATMRQTPRQPIVAELDKQYEIIDVDPASPISVDQMDVMLAVQPSSLGPQEMVHFVEAVKSGLPTAIFEESETYGLRYAWYRGSKTGTWAGPMAMFGGGGAPQPKGDIRPLWKALGIKIPGSPSAMGGVNPDICWQQYNPYPMLASLQQASNEWIFVRQELPGVEHPFSLESEISKGLRELMFLYAGVILPEDGTNMRIVNLVSTGENAGVIDFQKVEASMRSGNAGDQQSRVFRGPQVVAVYVEGSPADSKATRAISPTAEKKGSSEASSSSEAVKSVKAVYVADADCIASIFVDIRNRPEQFEEIDFRMQNITFLLNAIDVLAGEMDYPAIRRHEPQHSTLKLVEDQAAVALKAEAEKRIEYSAARDRAIQEAEAENAKLLQTLQEQVTKLQADATSPAKRLELNDVLVAAKTQNDNLNRRLGVKRETLERAMNEKIAEAKSASDLEIQRIQNKYKMLAVFLPPIPPLLIGVIVFVSRRLREREGIAKSRLK